MKLKQFKSVQYMYTVYRYVTMNGKRVKVYLEETPHSNYLWEKAEPVCVWTRNKYRASVISPLSALHYINVYSAKVSKLSFTL